MMRDDGLMIKHDDFKLLRGFADKQNDGRTDTGDCRVTFATEKQFLSFFGLFYIFLFIKNQNCRG